MDNVNDFDEKITKSIKLDTSRLKGEIKSLEKDIEKLLEKQKKMEESGKTSGKVYETLASKIRVANESLSDTKKQIDLNSTALKGNNDSLQKNKALLESLTSQYDRISRAKGNDSEESKKLNVLIGNLTANIEAQEKKINKSREVFDFHTKSVDLLKESLKEIKEKGSEFGPDFASTLESASKGFNAMKDGLSVVKTGFQGVGGAIKATGFGLLVLVLQSVVEYFTNTTKGAETLRQWLAGLGVVINTVKKGFHDFVVAAGDAFSNPVESIKKLGKTILENIVNHFTAVKVIYEGIVNMDFKKVNDGVIQFATGVANATDKARSAYKNLKERIVETGQAAKKAYDDQSDQAIKARKKDDEKIQEDERKRKAAADRAKQQQEINRQNLLKRREKESALTKEAEDERTASIARMSEKVLQGYAKEVNDVENHFKALKEKHKNSVVTITQLEKEKVSKIAEINKKFQDEDAAKLDAYHRQLSEMALEYTADAKQKALAGVAQETTEKLAKLDAGDILIKQKLDEQTTQLADLLAEGKVAEATIAQKSVDSETARLEQSGKVRLAILSAQQKKENEIKNGTSEENESKLESGTQKKIDGARSGGHESAALKDEIKLLTQQHDFKIKHEKHSKEELLNIEVDFTKKKTDLENKLVASKIHAGDKYIDAVLKNTKKDSAIYKAAFMAKKATAIADVIMNTKQAIIASFVGYAKMPFIGQALAIAQGAFIAGQAAMSIADIAKQKPGFAQGGQFISDGRGALLSGYSRQDNTNAYLRSGEAVVVSEAMRNPWARNLVSAINVAHGGRDFSIPNLSRGYATGGIFTDGGNASRYYSAPMNDNKDLANTLAYQMLNNFPPIYVDVKDVNNQQNILAQTVDRVNL